MLMQLFQRNTDPPEQFQQIQFRERSMIHEVRVDCVLQVAAAEIRQEDVHCFCAVAFLDGCVVLQRTGYYHWDTRKGFKGCRGG